MTEPTADLGTSDVDTDPDIGADPDGDPDNLNPRSTLGSSGSEGDPDGDPENLNPRDDRPGTS